MERYSAPKNSRKTPRLLALLAVSLCSFSARAFGEEPQRDPGLRNIKHIVVIYQENWSFDSLYGLFPGPSTFMTTASAGFRIRTGARGETMLRTESDTGWWLITHPDHARLAGAFAAAWGNAQFRRPEPRARVLHGISAHDNGWAARDAHPCITRQGKPSAFSIELVGKYSAFEEIDIADYLAVRERAARLIAAEDPYAGLLICMHSYNLLTDHADRSTISPEGLILLDAFLERQRSYQDELLTAIAADATLSIQHKDEQTILEHFRLLQACDNLSLLTCVAFDSPAHLLHPIPLNDGSAAEIRVIPVGPRYFRLEPWPFDEPQLAFKFPARHVAGKLFDSSDDLDAAFQAAPTEGLTVTLIA